MKPKYVSIKNMLKQTWQYGILLGQRSNGKSYAVKEHCLREAFKDPAHHKFVYLRRYQIETKGSDVEGYFKDSPISAITDNKYSMITVYRGAIYLSNYNEDTAKIERGQCIGYVMYLSGETHYKSQSYLDVSNVIFEEFITNEGYLWRENEKLESLISTIARDRLIRVWMIGNTISRLCPYFSEWGLSKIPTQKQGTIDIYKHEAESGTITIAVYFCETMENAGKMFFGSSAGMINKGQWQTRAYPHLPYHYRDCRKVYEIMLTYLDFCFKMELLVKGSEYMIFIHPHKNTDGYTGRHLINDASVSRLVTKRMEPVTKGDILFMSIFKSGRVFYSDNLTGSDFEAVTADYDVF